MSSWPDRAVPASASKRSRTRSSLWLIGVGGAVGTVLRFGIESAVVHDGNSWPTATFLINVSGAFVLAVLLEALSLHGADDGWRRRVRLGVGTGLLGGYTTYSSFMVETVLLGSKSQYLTAFGYAASSVVLGIVAAWAGMALVTALHRGGP
ncbi:MAG: fluoride efflux transporter FluC [Arachnia sp.]